MAATVRLEFNHLGKVGGEVRERLSQVVRKTAFDVEAAAKASMAGPKHGRVYERKSGEHQASAPGEAPAIDTGALAGSIQTQMVGKLTAEVSVGAAQGAALEFGTTKMAPRPFMEPALESQRDSFQAACAAAVEQGARNAAH